MKENSPFRILTIVMVMLLLGVITAVVAADGSEQLGPPVGITIAEGSGVVAAGTGLIEQPGEINIDVPVGVTVEQVLLYWAGASAAPDPGDDTVTVDGQSVTGTLIGGPTIFYGWQGVDFQFSAYRADITDLNLIQPGQGNTVTISDMDFSTEEDDGAGILVIYKDPTGANTAAIEIRDGLDMAYAGFAGDLKNTVPQSFTVPVSDKDRIGELTIFAASVEDDRPHVIRVQVGDMLTEYVDELGSVDGEKWDTLSLEVPIPAGETEVAIQIDSIDDGSGRRPASLGWVVGGLSVPTQLESSYCVDFSAYTPGTSVEGLGTITPIMSINSTGNAVSLIEGSDPRGYNSPLNESVANGGIGPQGGFVDLEQKHEYSFTFVEEVDSFAVGIVDYGDWNPYKATEHSATLIAYDINGNVVDSDNLTHTSNSRKRPDAGSVGDLTYSGDASFARLGDPGDYLFTVYGDGIVRAELVFENNSTDNPNTISDPLMALHTLCVAPPPPTCVDFTSFEPGDSVEGLGAVHPDLNIASSGNTIAIAEAVEPRAYGASFNSIINGALGTGGGFSDIDRNHDYTFSFADGLRAGYFQLRMVDYGDYNPMLASEHTVSLVAYDADGLELMRHELDYTSEVKKLPKSSNMFGNLQRTGDATAEDRMPGNFLFSLVDPNLEIASLALEYSSDTNGSMSTDPNFAFNELCFSAVEPTR